MSSEHLVSADITQEMIDAAMDAVPKSCKDKGCERPERIVFHCIANAIVLEQDIDTLRQDVATMMRVVCQECVKLSKPYTY